MHFLKIRVAFLDSDKNYLERIVTVFTNKFSDKLEIYSFSDFSLVPESLSKNRIDVLVADSSMVIDMDLIPSRCGFAYFVESACIETFKNQKTICKFQKIEMIYKEILGIYSEKCSNTIGLKFSGKGEGNIISFFSPSGGSGASVTACAAAKYFVSKGSKVLYLNFETLSSTDVLLFGDGQFDFSDVIFALKSKKSNMALKLESYVREDNSGVNFYASPKAALDMVELTIEDIKTLISSVKLLASYQYIVIDMDFSLSEKELELLKLSDKIVAVSDGSEISNKKVKDVINAFEIIEQSNDVTLLQKMFIFYNKFSNKTGKILDDDRITMLGGTPKFEHAQSSQVMSQLCSMDVFSKLI